MNRRGLFATNILLALMLASGALAQDSKAPPQPVPDATGIYKLGKGIKGPVTLKAPSFDPTAASQGRRICCAVGILFIIDANGMPQDVHVVESVAQKYTNPKDRDAALSLDAAAVENVQRYRFKPATLNGVPIPVRVAVKLDVQPW